jgi:hypothetical protein
MAKPYGNRFAHQNVSLSQETLALIAETEAEVTKELTSAHLALTVQRATDASGEIIPRRFICSTDLLGRSITAAAGTQIAAHTSLQRQIRMLGYEPVWTAFTDLTVLEQHPDDEPEQLPLPLNELEDTAEESEEAVEEPGEHEAPIHGLTVYIPKLDQCWLTPVSDPDAYRAVYLAAYAVATTHMSAYTVDKNLHGPAGRELRKDIAAVMMSGQAGAAVGIPACAVDPWALGTNSENEMPWIRVSRLPDPTTPPFRAGLGDARKTLSGTAAFPDEADRMVAWRERKAARRFVGIKGTAKTVGQKTERDAKRDQAHRAGMASKQIAINKGEDAVTAERDYKWVYCATYRNLGEVHAEYERQLAEIGVTEADILEYCKDQKSA